MTNNKIINESGRFPFRRHSGLRAGIQGESGRSMVEMLGVLAIMGVLSVGGIAGYRYAMDKMTANTILDEIRKRAVVASQQRILGSPTIDLTEFDDKIKGEYTVGQNIPDTSTFALTVADIPENICNRVMDNTLNMATKMYVGTTEGNTTCAGDSNTISFVFANDLKLKPDTENGTTPTPEPEPECTIDTDCTDPTKAKCDTETGTCIACTSYTNCTNHGDNRWCDNGTCKPCDGILTTDNVCTPCVSEVDVCISEKILDTRDISTCNAELSSDDSLIMWEWIRTCSPRCVGWVFGYRGGLYERCLDDDIMGGDDCDAVTAAECANNDLECINNQCICSDGSVATGEGICCDPSVVAAYADACLYSDGECSTSHDCDGGEYCDLQLDNDRLVGTCANVGDIRLGTTMIAGEVETTMWGAREWCRAMSGRLLRLDDCYVDGSLQEGRWFEGMNIFCEDENRNTHPKIDEMLNEIGDDIFWIDGRDIGANGRIIEGEETRHDDLNSAHHPLCEVWGR